MDAYKYSIFSGIAAPPPPVGNITVYFLLFYFSSPYMYTFMTSSVILDGGLPAPQWWPGI